MRIPADYRLPLSAKTIFVDELKGEIRRLGECSTRISECKRETLVQIERAMWQQRLAHLIVSGKKIHKNILSKKEQSMLNDPEIAVAYQQVAADYNAEIERQKGSSAFAGNGTYYVKQFTTLGDDIGDIGRTNIGTNFLILGWAKVRGHYAPVIRETFDTIGMVHSKDTMYISANERVALGRYYYDKIDSAREFYEMPFVEDYLYQYVNFKPGTVNDLWLRRNDYNEAFRNGKMYKLRDGQVDPFNVNLLEIGERVSMPIG
jgi:hypothetical protein